MGYIRFKGLTTLSNPSIFSARHSLRRSPSSPLGKPFLSNHSRYSSGRSIKTRPAYLPNGIWTRANLIRFSFSSMILLFRMNSMPRVPLKFNARQRRRYRRLTLRLIYSVSVLDHDLIAFDVSVLDFSVNTHSALEINHLRAHIISLFKWRKDQLRIEMK